jgi:hypothetical protein
MIKKCNLRSLSDTGTAMRTLLFILLITPTFLIGQEIEGRWQGSINVGEIKLKLVFKIEHSGDSLLSVMDSPDQGVKGIPVNSTIFQNDTLRIDMTSLAINYTGAIDSTGSIVGQFNQAGQVFPLTLERSIGEEKELKRPQEPKKPYPYFEEQLKFTNPVAQIKLAGTLTIPKDKVSCPAVVLISGSGAQNRNEEILGHKPFLVLADYLTRNGVAVLRYDDRGAAESEGNFSTGTAYDFSTDAEAAFNYLRSRKEVNGNRVGLIGHSEGGMIAPMIAARNNNVDFLVLLAGTGVRGDQVILKQSVLIGQANGIRREELLKGREINKGAFDLVLDTLNNDSLEQVLTRYFYAQDNSDTVEGITVEQMVNKNVQTLINPQIKYFIRYDPRSALTKVRCPILALNGERDLQVEPQENIGAIKRAVKEGGNTQLSTRVFPRLNHLFQECKTGSINEYGVIEQTISPDVLQEISKWINSLEN